MEILKKCGGIPLAIITVASMLASIPNKTNYECYRVCRSMGSGLEKDKSLGNMQEILHLSYGDLPSNLKPCLLYLSMFPEDYEIRREHLIRLWVAEGFVDDDGQGGNNLYEHGERYFNELVNRSMIQPVDIDLFGVAKACRVHDIILDLIISLSTQENFATISGGPNLKSSTGKIRRLSLHGSGLDSAGGGSKDEKVILPTMADVFHVRTLFSLGDTFQWMAPNLSKFSVLRVLLLECSGKRNNGYFKGLAHLHYLKYLGLRSDGVKTKHLEEIKGLKHLETLDLRGTSIRELPASIVQLKKLKHLITERVVMFPDGIGDLVSLQQLEWLEARESLMAELGNLTGLRVLKIYGLHDDDESCVKTFLQSLSNLHNIHALYINCHYDWSCSLDCIPYKWSAPPHLQQVDGHLSKVPRLFSSLSELSCLSIMVHSLSQDDLQPLGSLPVLRFLDLNVNWWGIAEERLVIGTDQPFRAITDFKFEHRTRCWLVFCSGVMPKLERLDLYFEAQKREGGGFDVGLQNLTSKVIMDCDGARITEVDDIEAKCRDTIDKHPNRPTLELSRKYEWLMRNEESLKDQPTTLEMRL